MVGKRDAWGWHTGLCLDSPTREVTRVLRQVLDPRREMKGCQPLNGWLSHGSAFRLELNLQQEWGSAPVSGGQGLFPSVFLVSLSPFNQSLNKRFLEWSTAARLS